MNKRVAFIICAAVLVACALGVGAARIAKSTQAYLVSLDGSKVLISRVVHANRYGIAAITVSGDILTKQGGVIHGCWVLDPREPDFQTAAKLKTAQFASVFYSPLQREGVTAAAADDPENHLYFSKL